MNNSSFAPPAHPARRSLWLLGVLSLGACLKQPPQPPKPYVAFVANTLSNNVAAVDLKENRVVASFPVPQPLAVKMRPGSREVWAVSGNGRVSVIGYPEFGIIRIFSAGGTTAPLIFSSDGHEAYLPDPKRGDIVFLDADLGIELARVHLAQQVKYLALAPDGKTMVASETDANKLAFVDVRSHKLLGESETGPAPGPLVISNDSSQVFVADTGEKKVSVFDVAERKLLVNLETGYVPLGLILKPDGGELFALSAESTLVILDAFHDDVEQIAAIGVGEADALIAPKSGVLYIATAGDGNVMGLEIRTRHVLASTHIGTRPVALALTPDERFLVAADAGASSLAVLRTDPASLVATIPVGSGPASVVIPDWVREP